MNRIVFAALPSGNGPLHFGRIGGSLLPADIYTRYLRLKGETVRFVSGTDCYGTAITYSAQATHQDCEAFVRRWHDRFIETINLWHIRLDRYGSTMAGLHHTMAQQLLAQLRPHRVTLSNLYCPTCQKLLHTRYFEAQCAMCDQQTTSELCEHCGNQNQLNVLRAPTCRACKHPAIIQAAENYVIRLDTHRSAIRAHFTASLERTIIDNYYQSNRTYAKPVLRRLPWGVPTHYLANHVIYVWIQALLNYLYLARGYTGEFIHFIGVDNLYYHTVVWGHILLSLGLPLPTVYTRRWYLLDNKKQSSSRRHYLDLYQLDLSPEHRDLCRAYLWSKDPRERQASVSLPQLGQFSRLFVNYVHNLYYRSYSWLYRHKGISKIPFTAYQRAVDPRYDQYMLKSDGQGAWRYLLTVYGALHRQFQLSRQSWTSEQILQYGRRLSYTLQYLAPICPVYYQRWVRLYAIDAQGLVLTTPFILKPFEAC